MHINTFKYTPEDVDCKFCAEFSKRKGCTAKGCPFLNERIEAGVVGYQEAVLGSFPYDARLTARLHTLIYQFHGSLWLDEEHHRRMEILKVRLGYRKKRDTPAYFAAMYLLTSNRDIYTRTSNCFCRHGLELDYVTLDGISPQDYTLLCMARDIYADTGKLSLIDLADREVVDTQTFALIVNALLIARYGCAVFYIREQKAYKPKDL